MYKEKPSSPYYQYAKYIQYMYGITIEEYEDKLEKQKGVCAICTQPETRKTQRRLCVDHDHATGKIRDLLCQRCNSVIGYMKEDVKLLENAIAYLKKYAV